MNAPPNTKIAGGLAFQGQPAYSNPVAREMINPSQAQVGQSLQQEATRQVTRAEEEAAQRAAELASVAKLAVMRRAVMRRVELPAMREIARAQNADGTNPILDNTGLVLT